MSQDAEGKEAKDIKVKKKETITLGMTILK
jgi:hypothetical protein